jgi:hypothetical protein
MTPAPGAGSEGTKKKRRRRKPAHRSPQSNESTTPLESTKAPQIKKKSAPKPYAKRVDEVSAGGLVINRTGDLGLLIGRFDHKDPTGTRLLWSLPKGHIEEGETPEVAAIREVAEETGITSEITQSLGLANDSMKYPDSIFYEGYSTTQQLSKIDKEVIKMLYK